MSATTHAIPRTMTAVVQRGYGTTDVLSVDRLDVPEPGEGQVLLRVGAAGVDRGAFGGGEIVLYGHVLVSA